ncbi:MAG: cupin domain-containing protein [Bacteroidales bacterium]|jgi:anti-sigma factor ChrR (cupin superfamily)|nr:cupin domain-containing protein [Bacteroidales bacterium]MDD2571478.1 cupin domain-containing protein [Bacteroidales bacterium]MDD2812500.1 cupin domain-containing protein [Bacteroidales bacterium]MDD3385534.1 cupin domain-containing protein [Bacteroidales bacterium]MDD3872329.1 cupin domain-containing protein [Bacteroidales bacterium]
MEYGSGAKKKTLRDENGKKTILLKLPENFYMADHTHVNTEQHFILKGEYKSEGKLYHAGDYQIFNSHENHGPLESEKGALVLVVWASMTSHNVLKSVRWMQLFPIRSIVKVKMN